MTNFAVLGSPIAHSLSPAIHSAAYVALGLDWQFTRFEVGAGTLANFLASDQGRGLQGTAVTMPLKQEAAAAASEVDEVVAATGVANTLHRNSDGSLSAYNTDVPGLAAALTSNSFNLERPVLLGAGATALSAGISVLRSGAESVTILARRAEAATELSEKLAGIAAQLGSRAQFVAADFSEAASVVDPTAVVSTLPGTASLELPHNLLGADLFDVAYAPRPTPLESQFTAAGSRAVTGLAMLCEQALIQVRIFVNGDAKTQLDNESEVRQAITSAVAIR